VTECDAVDLFAGPGGWDLAARQLGIDVVGIENDGAACLTREAVGHRTIQADIRDVEPFWAPGLIASPPCPTFSAAGKGSGRKQLDLVSDIAKRLVKGEDWRELTAGIEDPRTALVLEPLHWIYEMHKAGTPYRWIAMEQVPTVLPLWSLYAELLREMGYSVVAAKLTSEMYGVPQTRVRAILVASLDREAVMPAPTHSRYYTRDRTKLDPGMPKWVSMSEALGWTDGELVGFPRRADTPSNMAGDDVVEINGVEYRNRDLRTADQPAQHITGKIRSWNRWLVNNTSEKAGVRGEDDERYGDRAGTEAVRVTVQEAAVLQSFPSDYPWQGTKTKQHQQVGNAIPPLLAYHVLGSVTGLIEQSNGHHQLKGEAPMARQRNTCEQCGNETRNRKRQQDGDRRLCDECRKAPNEIKSESAPQVDLSANDLLMAGDEVTGQYIDELVAQAPDNKPVSEILTEARTAEDVMKKRIADARAKFDARNQPAAEPVDLIMAHDSAPVEVSMTPAPQASPEPSTSTPVDPEVPFEMHIEYVLPYAPPPVSIQHPIHVELIDIIEKAIHNHPRSKQTLIGPSEIGTECLRCLAKKLLGIPQTRDAAWLPQVGTAVHSWLDDVFTDCDCGWHPERRVIVGIIGNRLIGGTCDLNGKGTVVDHKIVGAETLKKLKKFGPKPEYRVQDHMYGRGYELLGEQVTDVSLLFLPRNSPTLADSMFWTEPYDRDIALRALERAEKVYRFVTDDPANILKLPRAVPCYDCYRYAQLPGEDDGTANLPKQGHPFAGITTE
jgi:DNA (cytosine-5)-methyltransferase 1